MIIEEFVSDAIRIWNEKADPRSSQWFILSTPFPVLMVVKVYLIFVVKHNTKKKVLKGKLLEVFCSFYYQKCSGVKSTKMLKEFLEFTTSYIALEVD